MRTVAYTKGSGSQRLLFDVHLKCWMREDFCKTSMRVREPRDKKCKDNTFVIRNEAVNQVEKCPQIGCRFRVERTNHRRVVVGYLHIDRVREPLIGVLIA